MPVFLSQHGKSAAREVDPLRGLTPEGVAEVAGVARTLSESGLHVDVIWHSGKARAAETAEIFAASLRPPEGVKPRDGINPLDDVAALADGLAKDRSEMFVGHLPFMERLLAYLITGNAEHRVLRFQNGGVVALDWDKEGDAWLISWTVFARL